MTTSSKVVFFGTEIFSVPSLRALLAAGYNIACIVTKPDSVKGRGKKQFVHPVKQIGLDYHIPVLQPEKLTDIISDLENMNATAAVLVSYGKIIPERVLNVFEPVGVINLHPSRLPKYRGPSPVEATILAGDHETAISIMKLDRGMDTGPIYVQEPVALSGTETKPELSEKLAQAGAELLVKTLPAILSGELTPKPQENTDVSVTSLISKQDGVLDPTTDDAETLERKIRAYQSFPKPHLSLHGHDVVVTSSKIAPSASSQSLVVPCAGGSRLEITSLVAPSGREMSGQDFLRGYAK